MSIKRKINDEEKTADYVDDKKRKRISHNVESNDGYQSKKNFKNDTFRNKESYAEDKPPDWSNFKKEKKELRLKRKSNKNNFDIIVKAKKMGELLRRKALKNGEGKRNKLIHELHSLLKSKGEYSRFVLSHDTSRIIQWLLKFSSPLVRAEIAKELKGTIVVMMQSKYSVFCVKRLLKYGDANSRKEIIEQFYGNVVKLASHAVSAPVLEYAYSTWATNSQKYLLMQEFYGDMYKNSKDNTVKCLNDVFKNTPNLKSAALSACKLNLSRIINKSLLDSGLIHSVLYQFLTECNNEDKTEFITQLSNHAVILSNSKDGTRALMQCIWQGSNKIRKVIIKAVKIHLVELCKHEFGYRSIIALLDSADDTVILNKVIVSEILNNVKDLSTNEWGRKVLLWLVVPGDNSYFHPIFIKELADGLKTSTSKKSGEIRRQEILDYSIDSLHKAIIDETQYWLSNSKTAYEMLGFFKSERKSKHVKDAFEAIARVIVDPSWKIEDVSGVEHAGMHLVLKKLLMNDKKNAESFGESLLRILDEEIIKSWILLNRGCFLLVFILENNSSEVQQELNNKIKPMMKLLKKQSSPGAKILLEKLKSVE